MFGRQASNKKNIEKYKFNIPQNLIRWKQSQKEKQKIKSGLNILIPNGFSNLKSQYNGKIKIFGAFNIKFRFHKKKVFVSFRENSLNCFIFFNSFQFN